MATSRTSGPFSRSSQARLLCCQCRCTGSPSSHAPWFLSGHDLPSANASIPTFRHPLCRQSFRHFAPLRPIMPPPRPAAPTIAVSAVQQLIVKHLDQLCKGDAHVAELAAQRTDLIAQLSSRDTTISGLTTQRAALLTLVSTEQLRLGELLLQAGLSAASTLAGQSSARPPPSRSPSRAVTKPRQAHSPTLVGMAGITGRSPQQQIRDEHIQPIVISDASGPPSVTPSPLRPSLATDAAPPHPILATISALTADLPTPGPSLPPANCNCTPGVSGARLICERRLQTSQRDGELTPTRRPPYVDVLSTIPGHQPSPFLIQSNEPIGPVTPPTPPVGDHPAPQFYDLSPADFFLLVWSCALLVDPTRFPIFPQYITQHQINAARRSFRYQRWMDCQRSKRCTRSSNKHCPSTV